jgi:hypothetical protein
VEEHDVTGEQEQRERGRDRGGGAEAPRHGAPGEDRERIEDGNGELRHDRAGLEQHADHDRQRRAGQHRLREDGLRVEKLDPDAHVVPTSRPGPSGQAIETRA